jgi:hypothetical protein
MLSRGRVLKSFLLSLILVPLFWLGSRFQASHSDGFIFVKSKIESSLAVQSKIGRVTAVHFPIFSSYSAHYGVGYTNVHMELRAVGSIENADFEVDATKGDRVWQIKRALMDGSPIKLE